MSRRLIRDRQDVHMPNMKPIISSVKDEEFLNLVAVQLFEQLGIFVSSQSTEEILDAGAEVLELFRIYAQRKKEVPLTKIHERQNLKKRHLGGYKKQLVLQGFTAT